MYKPSKYLIYGLVDPRDGHLRYIGKSSKGLARPRDHWQPYGRRVAHGSHNANWIELLLRKGLTPSVVVLQDNVDPEILNQAEIFWIAYYRQLGFRLTNMTDGGDGRKGPCTWGDKISIANRGRIPSKETRQKMSIAFKARPNLNIGRKYSVEYKRNMAKACGIRPFVDGSGTIYHTLVEASQALGIDKTNISRVLRGLQKQIRGHVFKWVDKNE